jgi:hypothetical protein
MRRIAVTALMVLLLLTSAASAQETEDKVRSVIFPGWGQYSTGRYTRATVMMSGALLSVAAVGTLTLQYNRHVDSYDEAVRGFNDATYIGDAKTYYEQMTSSWKDADDMYTYRKYAIGALACMYIWSIVDIMIGPEASEPPVAVEIRRDGFLVAKTFNF